MVLAVEVSWWQLALIAAAPLVLLIASIAVAIFIEDRRSKTRGGPRPKDISEREVKQMLAFPYYVDAAGLRALSASLGIELPLSQEVTRARRLGLSYRGLGADRSRSVTAQLAGDIDLNRLAHELRFGPAAPRVAPGLGQAPYVSDEEVLESAITTIERSLGKTSGTREALARVRETYEDTRVAQVVSTKRTELQAAADANSLLFLSGEFDRAQDDAAPNKLRLTRFDVAKTFSDEAEAHLVMATGMPPEYWYRYQRQMVMFEGPFTPPGRRPATRDEADVPPGISIDVVLPDDSALTPAGAERIGRGHPFYARVIAHSPSFDADSGVFVCSDYAVWGVTRT
jgi:hypothetical protein